MIWPLLNIGVVTPQFRFPPQNVGLILPVKIFNVIPTERMNRWIGWTAFIVNKSSFDITLALFLSTPPYPVPDMPLLSTPPYPHLIHTAISTSYLYHAIFSASNPQSLFPCTRQYSLPRPYRELADHSGQVANANF